MIPSNLRDVVLVPDQEASTLIFQAMEFRLRQGDLSTDQRHNLQKKILSGELKADDGIPSVREYGASIGVNPNTVMRTYEKLTNEGIIYNKRGIGYFIGERAKDIVLENNRKEFLEVELPAFLKKMELLGLDPKELISKK